MSAPLYAKRQEIVSKIPNFWPLVFEECPLEIERYIQPSDSEIFAKYLTGLDVKRFEVPLDPEEAEQARGPGDPRSLLLRFEFAENEWFEDTVLEKKFWWRRSRDGWTGLVSEPVRVHWKKGKDPTQGLMVGAMELWEARKKVGDMSARNLPAFDALSKILENWNGENTSFFTWFAFISSRRWVSAEESADAIKAEKTRRQTVGEGRLTTEDDVSPDDEMLEQQVQVLEDGDSLANIIAEDLWPSAIKYFSECDSTTSCDLLLTSISTSTRTRGLGYL